MVLLGSIKSSREFDCHTINTVIYTWKLCNLRDIAVLPCCDDDR